MQDIGYESYAALAQSPTCPSNQRDTQCAYEVRRRTSGRGDKLLAELETEEDALAYVANLDHEICAEITIHELSDEHLGFDEICLGHFVWDAESGKYVQA
ncbi:hypothetical protein [Bradyrhizobium sp. OK095]|uniref:hypothetical protein n=1 Tax=Bradyrhizobium sp. OK095 TaxID=1882760 RepID=UPI0008B4743A|nr:hypothetical protein [Bradyrhizobium sp. OK095]SEO09007.1 hypothetical protein SAMN05443254_117142 [Bradyrhizobium sp. OK095]